MFRRMLFILLAASAALPVQALDTTTYRQWVTEMKEAPRGPFDRLRWFCNDGTVHPPKPYPCESRGGGHQHGEWSSHTRKLRSQGYQIANLLAGVDPADMLAKPGFIDSYAQLLIERYLMGADDGWIMRQALFYRGAIQEEDEREGARALLEYLLQQPGWVERRFPALRTGSQLLRHGKDSASAQQVRRESAELSDLDKGFVHLRAKIHGAPAASDAALVREYAAGIKDAALVKRYLALADMIDQVYLGSPLPEILEKNARIFSAGPWLQKLLRGAAADLSGDASPANSYRVTARLLGDLRENMARIHAASARLRVLDLSREVEAENFRASTELRQQLDRMTRQERLQLIDAAADAIYGSGLIKQREREALKNSLADLVGPKVSLQQYRDTLRYLGRAPGWATQNLRFFFYEPMQKLAEIEPKAMLFIQDQLRGSPLLFYSQVLDGLSRDGNRLAGVRHKVFDEQLGVGFSALNPGIAVGVLHARPNLEEMESFDPEGIYLLPETVSDLPPIAGILTAGEGNPLSHVQLLARNLGIPNVTVNESLLPQLGAYDGKKVVLAVSPSGLVELSLLDADWATRLAEGDTGSDVVIRPDLEKLDLSARDFISLDKLRADDSGRTVGPKAAKLGGLRKAFPESVAPGVAIPFGIFKAEVLDRPYKNGQQTVFEWMEDSYSSLAQLPASSPERKEQTEQFRAELYELVLNTRPSAHFRESLATAMRDSFGDSKTGVFVRSDTNVEDLPGFTGAGLNLTLPNVVGKEELLHAINRVWASPFTARAFAWRQSHMETPQHVYTSILLLQAVASDKSGVLVTQDLDSGDREVLSVAVNEGVGGAVDGQAAESLRIDSRDGSVRLMATATAPWRRRPAAGGGIEKLPASGNDSVLQPAEIERLIRFARDELPVRFPPITDDAGKPAAADVEFGFVDSELRLFQIRPFLESRSARGNTYLAAMDAALAAGGESMLKLDEVPAQ